jgi:hypothetical protein
MAKAIETFTGYTMDYTSQIQYAKSESGKVFTRGQYRDPRYGYKWAPWRETAACAIEGKQSQGPRNWRLPA